MTKRTNPPVTVEIDQDYESRVNALENLGGSVTDHETEPYRPVIWNKPSNYVQAAQPQRELNLSISPQDTAFLAQAHQAVGQVVNAPRREREHSGHTRQTDNAMGIAKSSAYYAGLYIIAFAGGLAALLFMIWYGAGGDFSLYFGGYVILLCVSAFWMLDRNREKGLFHSSTGVAHHELDIEVEEIQSRERIALGVVDKHLALLERKMDIELEIKRLEARNGRNSDH